MSEPGDWTCNSCQYTNFKTKKWCRKCNTYKHHKVNKNVNDWTCCCSEVNFAHRTECRKCGQAKPSNWYCIIL